MLFRSKTTDLKLKLKETLVTTQLNKLMLDLHLDPIFKLTTVIHLHLTLIVMTNQSSVSTNPLRIHPPRHQAVSDNAPAKHLVVPSPTFMMAPIALNASKTSKS